MHHRFAIFNRNKPKSSGGAAAEWPHPPTPAAMAIDRRLDELGDMTFQAEPIRRLLDTGPPQHSLCLAA